MDITFAVEPFQSAYSSGELLTRVHYAEISQHKAHGFELKPQIGLYLARAARGEVVLMVGRLRGEVVAYFLCFVAPGMHYADCLTATGDLFYVAPDHRTALTGSALFDAMEQELKRRGVNLWFAGEKIAHPCGALFKRKRFEPFEITHAKWL